MMPIVVDYLRNRVPWMEVVTLPGAGITPTAPLPRRSPGSCAGVWSSHVGEALAEDCAADGRYAVFLTALSLTITGSVGSPLNPPAIK